MGGASGNSPIRETSSPDGASLAELLTALSFASGLALGDRMEHGLATAFIALRLAEAIGADGQVQEAVYYGALLKDAGCTACAPLFGSLFPVNAERMANEGRVVDKTHLNEILSWLSKGVPRDAALPAKAVRMLSLLASCGSVFHEAAVTHCELAEMFAQRFGFGSHVQAAVKYQAERWDGKGPAFGLKRDEPPLAARILSLSQVAELCYGLGGRTLAEARIRDGSGSRFDPELASAFTALVRDDGFWQELESDLFQQSVLSMRPATSASLGNEARIDETCEALADFADIKARSRWNHSTDVAQRATAIGARMGLSADELRRLRRAALVHDLGIVAVPAAVLTKAERLAQWEDDQLRLHSYYTERILGRVGPLHALALEASSDHEWWNGEGWHHHSQGEQIPLAARILAVADVWAVLEREEGHTLEPPELSPRLQALAGSQLDPTCCEAVLQTHQGARKPEPVSSGKLSQREIEVLELLAQGFSNPQIAHALVISKKTVEHHLEHVYDKLGVSSRTSAVAYAVHHRLARP